MGRATELFDYLNRDHEPLAAEKQQFCSLTITDEMQRFRKERHQHALLGADPLSTNKAKRKIP